MEKRFRVAISLQIEFIDPLLEKAIFHLQEKPFEFFFLSPNLPRTLENVEKIKNAFHYLGYRGSKTFFPIGPFNEDFSWWSTNIRSPYLGPLEMHIDLSNRCNHSCHFCGLYSTEAIEEEKRNNGGNISEAKKNFMKQILPSEKGFEILKTIPYSVKKIQFGGAGEPTMHPNFLDYVRIVREQGIALEILSNLSIKDEGLLKELHSLGSSYWTDLNIVANISGATPETYVATRPKQTREDFYLVTQNIRKLGEWRRANNHIGATCTMMMVLTNRNFRECIDYVKLAYEIGAYRVYLKPLEIHAAVNILQAPTESEMLEYKNIMDESLSLARKLNLQIMWGQ
jgi:MoaA/NifB/PqqE/SkfB family radical SAM enzyme